MLLFYARKWHVNSHILEYVVYAYDYNTSSSRGSLLAVQEGGLWWVSGRLSPWQEPNSKRQLCSEMSTVVGGVAWTQEIDSAWLPLFTVQRHTD